MYIRNAWYVGAWDHEVGRQMLRRVLLDEPVVFFRREDGTPVAIEDRCCHRQAPLSMGKLIGDVVQCPYHGLQFDEIGRVVHIPTQTQVPPGARVKSYPVVERNHWIWIWMGDPAKADPDKIEDFHWMDDPGWRFGGDKLLVQGNYLLLIDNLLDTTHLPFIHPTTLGTDAFAGSELETIRKPDRVHVNRWLLDSLPAPFHQKMGGFPDGMKVDRWQLATFAPPAFVKLDVGSAPVGTGVREGNFSKGVNMYNLSALTPESERSTHYFWAQAYNFKLDQRWIADLVRQQINIAFAEDLAIVNAQQANIDLGGGPVIDLNQDAGGIAARKIVERLIAEEQGTRARVAAAE
jgi:vanillate O-demethylase monooxygenase subunit